MKITTLKVGYISKIADIFRIAQTAQSAQISNFVSYSETLE